MQCATDDALCHAPFCSSICGTGATAAVARRVYIAPLWLLVFCGQSDSSNKCQTEAAKRNRSPSPKTIQKMKSALQFRGKTIFGQKHCCCRRDRHKQIGDTLFLKYIHLPLSFYVPKKKCKTNLSAPSVAIVFNILVTGEVYSFIHLSVLPFAILQLSVSSRTK